MFLFLVYELCAARKRGMGSCSRDYTPPQASVFVLLPAAAAANAAGLPAGGWAVLLLQPHALLLCSPSQ